jgi:hypothetical protein
MMSDSCSTEALDDNVSPSGLFWVESGPGGRWPPAIIVSALSGLKPNSVAVLGLLHLGPIGPV